MNVNGNIKELSTPVERLLITSAAYRKTLCHWKCIVAMSSNLSELEKIKFQSRLSLGEHSPKLNNNFSNNPDLALTFSITSSFFKELSKAKDKYPDFIYI
jgi:hypothetical protein